MSKKNLEILCRLTAIAADVNDSVFTEVLSSANGWHEILELWDQLLEGGAKDIFEESAHCIMWGIPREYCRSPYQEIVDVVISEMLLDGDAFSAWDGCESFEDAVGYMSSEMDPNSDFLYRFSIEHYYFVCNKFLLKVKYSKRKYADDKSKYEDAIIAYETAVKKVVPTAADWCEDMWIDENNILDEIYKIYDVDYRMIDFNQYSHIVTILMGSADYEIPCEIVEAWCACNIKNLPIKLAQVIWPIFTTEKMKKMFLIATEEADAQFYDKALWERYRKNYIYEMGAFDYCDIFDSWLYPHIVMMNQDPAQFDPDIKKRLYDVEIKK